MRPYLLSVSAVALSILAACSDATGPASRRPPGKLIAKPADFSDWTWIPETNEILLTVSPAAISITDPNGPSLVAVRTDGQRRVLVSSLPSGRRLGSVASVVGTHVYFDAFVGTGSLELWRVSVTGTSAPERVLAQIGYSPSISPDERTVAWTDATSYPRQLVLADVATDTRKSYSVQSGMGRVRWSPGSTTLVSYTGGVWAKDGIPIPWLAIGSGTVSVWQAPSDATPFESSTDIGWLGETPQLYVYTGGLTRYDITTGAGTVLIPGFAPHGEIAGWSPDYQSVFISLAICSDAGSGAFSNVCTQWHSTLGRLALSTNTGTNVLDFHGAAPIRGRVSPDGSWLGYVYDECGGGCHPELTGLYAVSIK